MQVVRSLRYCRGISANSLISTILPSHDRLDETIRDLRSMSAIASAGRQDQDRDQDEEDMKTLADTATEAADFIANVKYQDTDKHAGLIFYYGYIESSNGSPQRIYHTFPYPSGHPALNVVSEVSSHGARFDLDLLNRNPWYTEAFGEIK
jgi:hypothetical protein